LSALGVFEAVRILMPSLPEMHRYGTGRGCVHLINAQARQQVPRLVPVILRRTMSLNERTVVTVDGARCELELTSSAPVQLNSFSFLNYRYTGTGTGCDLHPKRRVNAPSPEQHHHHHGVHHRHHGVVSPPNCVCSVLQAPLIAPGKIRADTTTGSIKK